MNASLHCMKAVRSDTNDSHVCRFVLMEQKQRCQAKLSKFEVL